MALWPFFSQTEKKSSMNTASTMTEVTPETQSYKKRKELYAELKWSSSCEESYEIMKSAATDITSYEISQNRYLLEVPCGMTNQGPMLSYVYQDTSQKPAEIKQLQLKQYIKDNQGNYKEQVADQIPSLASNFKNQQELSIMYRSTAESSMCYYSWTYIFNTQTRELDLTYQDHSESCDDKLGSSTKTIIDFPKS